MNYEILKYIYTQVLKYGCKFQYHGDERYTLTGYYENGNKYWETNYHQGQRHGKDIGWCENGNKWWEVEYKHGKLIK